MLGCVHALSRSFITLKSCKVNQTRDIFSENFVGFPFSLCRGSVVVIMGAFYLHASFPRLAWTYFDRGGVMANCCFAASNWQFRICGFDSRKQAKVITDNGLILIRIKHCISQIVLRSHQVLQCRNMIGMFVAVFVHIFLFSLLALFVSSL